MRRKTFKWLLTALLLVAIPATLTVYLLIIPTRYQDDLEELEKLLPAFPIWTRAEKMDAILAIVAPSGLRVNVTKQGSVCDTVGCLDQSLMLANSVNFSVDPCEDFYEFACGKWRKDNPVPEILPFRIWSRWEMTSTREIILKRKLIEMTSSVTETNSRTIVKARNFYNSCLKTDGCLKPLAGVVMKFGMPLLTPSWDTSHFNLSHSIGTMLRNFSLGPIIQSYVTELSIESRIQLDGPLLDASNETVLSNPNIEALFYSVIKDMADATGIEISDKDLQTDFEAMRKFEAELTEQFQIEDNESDLQSNDTEMLDSLKLRREEKNKELDANNDKRYLTTLGKYVKSIEPRFDNISPNMKIHLDIILEIQFENTGDKLGSQDEILVSRDLNITLLEKIMDNAGSRAVANFLSWRLIQHLLPYTTYVTGDKEASSGRKCTRKNSVARMRRCLQVVFDKFEIALDYAILPNFISPTKRSLAQEIAGNVTKGFEQGIEGWKWMGRATKRNALEKVQGMIQNIGYSDDHLNLTVIEELYSELVIQENGYFENLINIESWQMAQDLKEVREIIVREAWLLLPTSSWAAHSYDQNSISISANLLAHPFMSETGLQSINYGSLGFLIGHEIGHGFDTTCGDFNVNGTKENWWDERDKDAFYEILKCYVDQYNHYETEGGRVDGELTLDDNIADILGVEAAFTGYEAWVKAHSGGKSESKLFGFESFTAEQLFYLSFGTTWCSTERLEALTDILNDDHSPSRYRVIGSLQNSERFASAWNCKAGTFMNPINKCSNVLFEAGTDL